MSAAPGAPLVQASRLILTLVLVLLACAVASSTAAAGTRPGGHVSGGYAWNGADAGTTCEPASDVIVRCTTPNFVSTYTGDLVGTSTAEFVQTINCGTGRTVGQGTETFVGGVKGSRRPSR